VAIYAEEVMYDTLLSPAIKGRERVVEQDNIATRIYRASKSLA
jgi:hypothetical protein